MIFDSSKLGNMLAGMIWEYPVDGINYTNAQSAWQIRVIIGSGSQPTPAQVQTDWSTDYFLNDTGNTGTTGNSILCGYGDLWVDASVNDTQWEVTLDGNGAAISNLLYLGSQIPQSYYFRDGTANYAIIWFNESLSTTSASFPTDNFIVVPVTDITGNGIVKLSTINVVSSAPVLSSMNLQIGGGV